jgi:hypothetical protein
MSFEAVWGFDPDRVIQGVGLSSSDTETDKFTYSAEEQRAARIPSDLLAQVYELRRMYRL